MNGRKAIVGLCMLCALVFSAFAAQSASAVTKGTTAFTCKEVSPNTGNFKKAHCKAADAGTGNFSDIEVAENTTTEIELTNEKTNAETNAAVGTAFKETIGGVELELKSPKVTGTQIGTEKSSLTNKKDATTGEHFIEGTALYHYSGVEVVKPAGKGCKVFTDETATKTKGAEGIVDVHLNASTKGQGDFINFTPATGSAFATFFIECTTSIPAVEGTWEITGSAKCPVDGATILCTHTEVTTQNTLKGKGSKAGIEGPVTVLGRDPALSETVYTPLSVTTKETP
jgi:hypothetical protein